MTSHTQTMPKKTLSYPLSPEDLQVFHSKFFQRFNQSLIFTSNNFINQAFLEFADQSAEDRVGDDTAPILLNLVMDVVSAAEDCHASARNLAFQAHELAKLERPCRQCGQTGIDHKTFLTCNACGGRGRRPKRTRV